MLKFIIRRLISLIPVIIIISVLLFSMVKIMPGNQVDMMLGTPPASSESSFQDYLKQKEALIKELGLDKSLPEQYVRWMFKMLSGDLGVSTSSGGMQPVTNVLKEPLKNSIILNIFTITFSFLIAIPVGIKSAVKRFSLYDNFWQVTSLVFMSMPVFFIGLCLIYLLKIKTDFLGLPFGKMPSYEDLAGGFFSDMYQWGRHLFLPVVTLTSGSLAGTIRFVRNAMLEVIKKDYIRTARSKILKEKVVIYSHAFRNALIPVVTIVAGSLVGLFGGSAITEQIFAYNGIGFVLIKALNARDYSLILAMNMFYAILALVANLVMDISYALVDPRVKFE